MYRFFLFILLQCYGLVTVAEENVRFSADDRFDQEAVMKEAREFFGQVSEELSKVVARAFRDQGEPVAIIRGEEASAAIGLGLRKGKGHLYSASKKKIAVEWSGPSLGFDLGFDVSKVFMLIYKLPDTKTLYQRYGGVDGSLFFVAGVGLNYLRRENVIIAPIRTGVGWRQGASVSYLEFRPMKQRGVEI